MTKQRILCIDDDITMLNNLEYLLSSNGFEVSLSKSGSQALKLLERGIHCDLILLDVDMPEMDGYETFRKIQEIPNCDDVPILFLTGMDSPDFEIRGLEIGASDYIVKPFISSVLLARIHGQLRQRRPKEKEVVFSHEISELFQTLNASEQTIARYIAQGLSNQEISEITHYSYNYVKKMSSSVLSKLNLAKRSEIRKLLRSTE